MASIKKMDDSTQISLLKAMLDGSRVAALVTDPSQEDNPIVFVNHTFESLTGYPPEEVIGRNCRFLQGEKTNREDVAKVRSAIENEESITITIKNYRKDGSPFWNRLHIDPIYVDGQLYFIGTQTDVSVERRQRIEISQKEKIIEQLALPILAIEEDVAAVALTGVMTEERFSMLNIKLSEYVQERHTTHIILDVTGLYWEDDTPAINFLHIQEVLKLMGTTLYVTGISPVIARKLSDALGSSVTLHTFSSIRQAMQLVR
ncbi:PAS domain-containing protein [Bhargavaea cecembensis]|uniref:PAS domain-containing protein n=1 Tax=Bhargavaea cecembensis TaxID=394098 RepID=UPI00211D419E|nr:PAS domain-containing protein [Bhargavaea cecembensis]